MRLLDTSSGVSTDFTWRLVCNIEKCGIST
jgi:hypothetical protein